MLPARSDPGFQADWLAPGGHGLDDLEIDGEPDHATLAFLHLSEKAAASRFTVYRDVMEHDPPTRAIFEEILHDETFHMNYTLTQLGRIAPQGHQAAFMACAPQSPLEGLLAASDRACRNPRFDPADNSILCLAAAVRLAGQAC